MSRKAVAPALLIVLLLATAVLRGIYLDVPLERDEGEFAYGGGLILAGEVPYQSMYAMKLPGIYLVYAVFEGVFGRSIRGIHLGLLLVNLANIVIVYAIARRLFDEWPALIAAACFSILTFSSGVVGMLAQAEHFVLLPALVGAWLLLRLDERPTWRGYLGSGLMFGLALLVKQHGGAYLLFGLSYAATSQRLRWRRQPAKRCSELAIMSVGMLLPLAVACLVIALLGAWRPFSFWTFTYASEYIREVPRDVAWSNLTLALKLLSQLWLVWWVLGTVGLVAILVVPRWRSSRRFLLLWSAASCLAVVPGFYFRNHYFLFLAPSLAILSAAALQGISAGLEKCFRGGTAVGAAMTLGVLAWPLWIELSLLLPRTPVEVSRLYYPNVFADAPQIARLITENSGPGDSIAILGSEPELLFYSQRRSATGHIYMYPLMEPQPFALEMQNEAIRQIEAAQPPIFVVCEFTDSWGHQPDSRLDILYWSRDYVAKHFDVLARIELRGGEPAKFCLTPAELATPAGSESLVYILKRKKSA